MTANIACHHCGHPIPVDPDTMRWGLWLDCGACRKVIKPDVDDRLNAALEFIAQLADSIKK